MKITVEREPLAEAVAAAGRALSRSPQNPVLAGLLLEAAGSGSTGELTVSGYNYETSVRVRVPATVAEPGRALVSGRLLAAVVKPLGRSPVEIDAGDTAVALCCGTAKFSLPAMRAGDYPTLPAAGVLRGIVPVAALAEAVARVRPAADRGDGGLAQLTAIRLAADGDVLTLSATDRRRAARVTIAWDPVDGSESGGAPFAVLPPARTLAEMVAVLDPKATVTLSLAEFGDGAGVLALADDRRQTTTALIAERYPNLDPLLSVEPVTTATAATDDLRAAAACVVAVADEETIAARLAWTDGGWCEIDIAGKDDARGSDAVASALDGPAITHGVNARYLLDALSTFDSPDVRLSYTAPSKQVLIQPVDDAGGVDPTHIHMIAAMRLTS